MVEMGAAVKRFNGGLGMMWSEGQARKLILAATFRLGLSGCFSLEITFVQLPPALSAHASSSVPPQEVTL